MNITWTETMTVDDYRGEICMLLREQFLRQDLADEVGGKSDEWVLENFAGVSPDRAVDMILTEDENADQEGE